MKHEKIIIEVEKMKKNIENRMDEMVLKFRDTTESLTLDREFNRLERHFNTYTDTINMLKTKSATLDYEFLYGIDDINPVGITIK